MAECPVSWDRQRRVSHLESYLSSIVQSDCSARQSALVHKPHTRIRIREIAIARCVTSAPYRLNLGASHRAAELAVA